MKEDLKDIELFIDFCRAPYNFEHESDAKSYKELSNKIEHLIKAYKELEEENQQIEAIKDETIRRYNFESIPVSLVKEKIEELKKEIEQLRIEKNVTYDSGIYRNRIKLETLQELLEKRK